MSKNDRSTTLVHSKTHPLGLLERIILWYNGRLDGRRGYLRPDEGKGFDSSYLKGERDAYTEFGQQEMAKLKLETEDGFKHLNVLFDKVAPLRSELSLAKERLKEAEDVEVDLTRRKEGEERLTAVQVSARRTRERNEILQPLKNKVHSCEETLKQAISDIFSELSHIQESFDSAVMIIHRVRDHSQRRVDVYWRAAQRYIPELPAVACVDFGNHAEEEFATHLNRVVAQADKLRAELTDNQ